MDKGTALELARRFSGLVREDMPVKKVVLYGSHATGTARKDSDIDIAVVVDKLDGDFLAWHARLFKLRRAIDLRIEPVLVEENLDKSGFLAEILATGHVVYPEQGGA